MSWTGAPGGWNGAAGIWDGAAGSWTGAAGSWIGAAGSWTGAGRSWAGAAGSWTGAGLELLGAGLELLGHIGAFCSRVVCWLCIAHIQTMQNKLVFREGRGGLVPEKLSYIFLICRGRLLSDPCKV